MAEERRGGQMDAVGTLSWVFAAFTSALALFRFFDPDEIEHVHATWHVLAGRLPFVDFFEHHHPLLWYVLAPVLAVLGESSWALVAFRLIFMALALAIVRATYLFAIEAGATNAAARLATLLLLSTTTFVYVAVEIRPDVPQMLCGVLSALFLLRLFRTQSPRHAVLSGFAAALSFLFLQKALFLLAVYPFLFAVAVARGRLRLRAGAWWLGAFGVTVAPGLVWLIASGSWDDYLWSNWLLNVRMAGYRRPGGLSALNPFTLRDLGRNAVFWVMAIAVGLSAVKAHLRGPFAVPALLGLAQIGVVIAVNRVSDRYLAAAVPFLAVAVASWLTLLFQRREALRRVTIAVVALITVMPGTAMVRALGRTNRVQLAQIQYVLDRTTPADRIYDRGSAVNVFRSDAHYFWFMVGPNGPAGRGLAGSRRASYETCRVVEASAFVFNARGELEACGLLGGYRETPFPDLFERRDRPSSDPPSGPARGEGRQPPQRR